MVREYLEEAVGAVDTHKDSYISGLENKIDTELSKFSVNLESLSAEGRRVFLKELGQAKVIYVL